MKRDIDRRVFLVRASLAGLAAAASTSSCRSTRDVAPPHDLTELSATEAVAAMKNGDIKAEDYARALLDRAQQLERLNAFRTLNREMVLEASRSADKMRASGAPLGRLHGLPIPVKDSVNTTALPTSSGTQALKDFRPKADASVLPPVFAAGAILMGKTNLHELSAGWTSNNLSFGAIRNPYDPACIPGGSSGGSAVAVSARMAPLAIAEDTMGSIRVPSTMCGIAGIRPTYGRYPNDGIMPLADHKFDQVGPVARSVEDLLLFDSVVTGDATPITPVELSGLRIGVADFLMTDLDPEVDRVTSEALDKLRTAGVTIVKVDVPPSVKAVMQTEVTLVFYELVAAITDFLQAQGAGVTFDQLFEHAGGDIKEGIKMALPPARPTPAAYESALKLRRQIQDDIATYFASNNLVALALPPVMTPPPRIGDEGDVTIGNHTIPRSVTLGGHASLASCASLPGLVLPAGMSNGGLPIGLEFDGPTGSDRKLLTLGLSLQKALGPIAAAKL